MSDEEKAECKERIGDYLKGKEVTWPKIQKVMRQMHSEVISVLVCRLLGNRHACNESEK